MALNAIALLRDAMEALAEGDVPRLESLLDAARQAGIPQNGRDMAEAICLRQGFRRLLDLTRRNLLLLRRVCQLREDVRG